MKTSILLILCTISLSSYAQRRKAVFIEAAGNGILLTANYDMRFKPNQNNGLGFRAGIGGWGNSKPTPTGKSSFHYLSVPVSINYIVGKKSHGLEGGLGITPFYLESSGFDIIDQEQFSGSNLSLASFMNIGYRYQPVKSGVMFRANWAPAIFPNGDGNSHLQAGWAGLSLGYSFR